MVIRRLIWRVIDTFGDAGYLIEDFLKNPPWKIIMPIGVVLYIVIATISFYSSHTAQVQVDNLMTGK